MKRMHSAPWKKPFEREPPNSQDSAISSQGIRNSQCLELSQISTQDLFGPNFGSQNEQGAKKMSMYEKWLSKRSLSRNNSGDSNNGFWTPHNNQKPGRNDINQDNLDLKQGRIGRQATPSSLYEYSMKKSKAEERDESDLLEKILMSIYENKNEMSSLTVNLKEMLDEMGGSFSDGAKHVLSSFMEDITKSQEKLMTHIQSMEKNFSAEKDFEQELNSKDSKISALETKLVFLEDQVKKSCEDSDHISKSFQTEANTHHQNMLKKLEEMIEKIEIQQQHIIECKNDVDSLRQDFSSFGKEGVKNLQGSENRIMKEMRKLPKEVKNTMNVKSEVSDCIQGLSSEMENLIKGNTGGLSKEIKTQFSELQKKNCDKSVREHLNKIMIKMDSLINDHKKIEKFIQPNLQNSQDNLLMELSENVKCLQKITQSDDGRRKNLEECITLCQEKHSQKLQEMNLQQKELFDKMNSFVTSYTTAAHSREENYPEKKGSSERTDCSDEIHKSYLNSLQSPYPIEKSVNSVCHKNITKQLVPPKKVIQQVESNFNTISIPFFNQTNIYPSQSQFKQPYEKRAQCDSDSQSLMTRNINVHENFITKDRIPFVSPFKNQNFDLSHREYGTSPVATIKPIRHDDTIQRRRNTNFQTSSHFCNRVQTFCDRDGFWKETQEADEKVCQKNEYSFNVDNQEKTYWLRKRNFPVYNEKLNSMLSDQRMDIFKESHSLHRKKCHGKNNERDAQKTLDYSVYDFKEDNMDIPSQRKRSKLASVERDEKTKSPGSSPALTINFDWSQTPASVKTNQRILKSDYSRKKKKRNPAEMLFSDVF